MKKLSVLFPILALCLLVSNALFAQDVPGQDMASVETSSMKGTPSAASSRGGHSRIKEVGSYRGYRIIIEHGKVVALKHRDKYYPVWSEHRNYYESCENSRGRCHTKRGYDYYKFNICGYCFYAIYDCEKDYWCFQDRIK